MLNHTTRVVCFSIGDVLDMGHLQNVIFRILLRSWFVCDLLLICSIGKFCELF